jgi:hypothetical protein
MSAFRRNVYDEAALGGRNETKKRQSAGQTRNDRQRLLSTSKRA